MKKYIFLLYDLHLILIGLVLIYVGIKDGVRVWAVCQNVFAETLSIRGCLECYVGGILIGGNIAELCSDIYKFFGKK